MPDPNERAARFAVCTARDGGDCSVAAYALAATPPGEERCHHHGGPTAADALTAELDRVEALARAALRSARFGTWTAPQPARGGAARLRLGGTQPAAIAAVFPTVREPAAVTVHLAEHDPDRTIRRVRAARAVLAIEAPGVPNFEEDDHNAGWQQAITEVVDTLTRGWLS